jgi:DNA recombination protein RmuC
MSLVEILLIVLLLAVLAVLVLQAIVLTRKTGDDGMAARLEALNETHRHLENALREEQRAGRAELAQTFAQFRGHMQELLGGMSQQQHERIEGFGRRLDTLTERTDLGLQSLRQGMNDDARKTREESSLTLKHFGDLLEQRLAALTTDNEKRLGDIRGTLESKLKAIQDDNAAKLEQMRATVDEKLQATLETRLGQSFELVSKRLEEVQRGLGEMKELANGVGDLKRVLSNVKTRGTFGEVQLGSLLEQMLVAEQYASNVATVPGSNDRVEFAIRLPGQSSDTHVWLPVDAKFPREDYERLLDAQERADAVAAEAAASALERRIRDEAKSIRLKYVSPPHTTDFAILFLPTEGLYAEVLRRPGLFEALQRDHRVTIAGPTTFSALLNSLQMGFRTLAIEKHSSEVWHLLGAVKNEFGKFAGVLEKTKKKLTEASNVIDQAGVRSRAIERKLRDVGTLDAESGQLALDVAPGEIDGDEEEPGVE